ncbi:hypothetical protein [Halobacteriovorax sp. JY17]|uniref:hypothetical protein n=1 Tax=Halobacteriovorax sp. JY17 TaxID=2014617 RepID=UPI000C680CEF|nr:hypothetical protein [Halobacteriovorax sp. JY17]PIK13984.1 MAG: hypothetical protein CES88_13450 [Halobacteriovorax sp. JY17]
MSKSSVDSLKIKAKLLQKAKKSKGEEIALKEAFKIIAESAGYNSWKDLKDSYELADLVNPPRWSAQWKKWFSTKEEALEFLKSDEFILPYRKQFFVCDRDYLSGLDVDPDSTDFKCLGNDWTSDLAVKTLQDKLQKS